MNAIKNLIFNILILLVISLQNTYTMENTKVTIPNNTQLHILSLLSPDHFSGHSAPPPQIEKEKKVSKKAQKVSKFLDDVTVEPDKKREIVEYFNQTDSTPIFVKHSEQTYKPTTLDGIKDFSCDLLFGCRLHELKNFYYLEKLRKNNCYYFDSNEYADCKIDEKATEIALKLRSESNLDPHKHIPIFKKKFCYNYNISEIPHVFATAHRALNENNTKYHYFIETNSSVNKQFPDTSPFVIAHELAHTERGLRTPFKKLLLTKAFLGTAGLLLSCYLSKNAKTSWSTSILLGGITCLGSIINANWFKEYYERKEEKACDLRAIELCINAGYNTEELIEGVKKFFSLKPIAFTKLCGKDWAIHELKFKQLEKPLEHTTWAKTLFATHPSSAERLRYCRDYAEQLESAASDKNSYTRFCGYKIRKDTKAPLELTQ